MGGAADEITRQVLKFAGQLRGGLVGIVGLAFLVWTLIGTIQKVEDGFNYVWHVAAAAQLRAPHRRVPEPAGGGPGAAAAAFIALTHTALVAGPMQLASAAVAEPADGARRCMLAPYLMVIGAVHRSVMFIPNTRVRFMPALIGAAVAGHLWAAVGCSSPVFVVYSSRLTMVYAGFAIMIAALVWTYFGWLILLLGRPAVVLRPETQLPALRASRPRICRRLKSNAGTEHHVPGCPNASARRPR